MATAVFFHAHPDDECILTGGTMAKLAAEGHRVVLVFATRGELGEVAPGALPDGMTLGEARTGEASASAAVLGAARVEFLGYRDSGMMGEPTNQAPDCFWQADLDEAAARLAVILAAEASPTLVVYDDHGTYGHPDHIQVHRVGMRAGALAGLPNVYEATIDRDRVLRQIRSNPEPAPEAVREITEESPFGVREWEITTRVDVGDYVGRKRDAMRCHRTQIPDDSFWLTMPDDQFKIAFSEEAYIHQGLRTADPARPSGSAGDPARPAESALRLG